MLLSQPDYDKPTTLGDDMYSSSVIGLNSTCGFTGKLIRFEHRKEKIDPHAIPLHLVSPEILACSRQCPAIACITREAIRPQIHSASTSILSACRLAVKPPRDIPPGWMEDQRHQVGIVARSSFRARPRRLMYAFCEVIYS
jgi:hypothetical protein